MKGEEEIKKEDVEALKQKVKYFFDNSTAIHVMLHSGRFYNGFILEIPSADFFLLNDFKLGEQPIFFAQIEEVERFLDKRGGEDE